MSTQAPQKSPESYTPEGLLLKYPDWHKPKQSYTGELQRLLEYPSQNIWFQACKQALKDGNKVFLESPPLYLFDNGSLEDKKVIAEFISKCAYAALQIKNDTEPNNKREEILQKLKEEYPNKIKQTEDLVHYFCSENQLLEGNKAAVKVLLAGNDGILGQLEIEKIPNGNGKIFPDPVYMSFSHFENDFEDSLSTALKYITNTKGVDEAQNYNFRWRLFCRTNTKNVDNNFRVLDNPLKGSSMGLASALAFLKIFDRLSIPIEKFAFTGEIDENGVLKSVGKYPEKLGAGKNFTIYFPDVDHKNIEHFREDGYSIKEVVTVEDAITDIKDKNKRKKFKIFAGILGSILILSSFVGLVFAWQSAIIKAENERKAKEMLSQNLEAEKLNSIAKDNQLQSETQKTKNEIAKREYEEKLTETEKLKKENAIKAQRLAEEQTALEKQQSKILTQKNVELDKAKQVAENNEKEATFQKGVAIKNEEIARASQQVAFASRFAAEGYKRLAEGDKASAQTFFAQALSLDEQEEYRTGLLSASFDSGNNSYKLSWSKEVADDAEISCCPATALDLTGDLLAVSYNNGNNVKILKTKDGSELFNFSFEKNVADLALSAEGKYLAVKNYEGKISILETANQNVYFNFDAQHDQSLQSLIFSNDNKYLAAISGSHSIIVLDVQNKKIVKNINHEGEFTDLEIVFLTFSFDNLLSYTFNGGPIFITSVSDESVIKRINMWSNHYGLGFTKKGELISSDGTHITIYPDIREKFKQNWMPDSKSIRQKVRPDYQIAANSAIPYFVSAGDNGVIHFRNGDEQIQQISFPMGKPVKLMLGENGRVIFQNTKGKIYCWESNASIYKKYEMSEDALYAAGVINGLDKEGNKILVKDLKSEKVVFSLELNQSDAETFSASLSVDKKNLAITRDGKSIEIYDVKSGKKTFQYLPKENSKLGEIFYLVLSNDKNKIAAAGANSIAIISIPNSQILWTIDFPLPFSKNFHIGSLSFSPQDSFFVFQSENSVNLFDLTTGKLKHFIPFSPRECPKGAEFCSWMAISPDEKFLGLTTFEDGMVQLWSIEDYRYLANVVRTGVESPERAVGAVFTKDSRFLIWNSAGSGRLHFYDIKENKKLPDFPIGESIESFGLTASDELLLNGVENYYITDGSNITSLLKDNPQIINSRVFSKTGFRIDSSYSPSFSQDELNSILKNERPKFELFAVDQNGLDVRSEKDFGGSETGTARKTKNGAQCSIAFSFSVFNVYSAFFGNGASGYCSDFAMIDIARDTPNPQFAKSQKEYFSTREYHAGDQLVVLLYINNGAANNLDPKTTVARNVKITTSLTRDGNLNKITATFSADNAAPLTGSVTVQTNSDENLEIYPNSGFIYSYDGKMITDAMNLNLGDSTLNLGDLDGDWQYSLFLSYKIKVVKK